jgi:formate dehydrogenase major subunit
VVYTQTKRVRDSRKTNLELLLSNHRGDCRPPCVLACPAHTDCQGYAGLIANGEYREAVKLVRDRIPLPASLGRVCPHPCETDCRRGLIEEPISIQQLKRFVADYDLSDDNEEGPAIPDCAPDTGRSVGIIGGGPMGLSAAFFLRQKGHDVTIYESMPKAGGMLRYGIPEYRLPKEVVDAEIAFIEAMGVDIVTDTRVGVDIPFETLRADHDALLLGIGAWVSTGTGCKGEDLNGVYGGIDFLRRVVRNEPIDIGRKVAIVGGGNTAMDACRTAVRLGAETVYNVYRRTRNEMPADEIEIDEAEEEGVVFKNLTNPLEIRAGRDGRVRSMKLQIMELGEPDESGRRRPIPVKGQTETLDVDTVILAIGQRVDAGLFRHIKKTDRGGIAYDPATFMTSMEGVFAGGDCGNDKISIAVEAIADARGASQAIDAYLRGEEIAVDPEYLVTRDDITEKTFEDRERLCRPPISELTPEERKDNFSEVVPDGFDEESALREADRCLGCGCHDYYECKLIDYARRYDVHPERFAGEQNTVDYDDEHPFIVRDPNKCILCGLCVRACDQLVGMEALGFAERGFDTVVLPNMHKPLAQSGCMSCGQCVSVCPCGALQERQSVAKEVPLETEKVETTCPYCSVGCSLTLEYRGNMLIKADPRRGATVNDGLACGMGKFGFDCAVLEDKIEEPQMRRDGAMAEASWHDALMMTVKKAEATAMRYGRDAVAVSISDRYTCEEAYAMQKLARAMGAKTLCFDHRRSGLADVLGSDASPNRINELLSTNLILAVGLDTDAYPVLRMKMKQAARDGAKVLVVNPGGSEQEYEFAAREWNPRNSVAALREIAKALLDLGAKPVSGTRGITAFRRSLREVKPGEAAKDIAAQYLQAKKAMIVFGRNEATPEAAALIADLAVLSGHIGGPRDGILQIEPKNNSQGLRRLGIVDGAEAMDGVKALLCFGEDPDPKLLKDLDFLMVCDTHPTEATAQADVILPGTGFASTDGSFLNTERRLLPVQAAIDEGIALSNWEIAAELAAILECDLGFDETADITRELAAESPAYRQARGTCIGGITLQQAPKLAVVERGRLTDPLPCTDHLQQMIRERLPQRVRPTAAVEQELEQN